MLNLRKIFLPVRPEVHTYAEELHFQSFRVAGFGATLLTFVSTPYFYLDPILNPHVPALFYLRLGQSVVGAISLLLIFIPICQRKAMYLLVANLLYIQFSGAAIAALSVEQPIYTGAYAFVIVVSCLFPVFLWQALSVVCSSVIFYALLRYAFSSVKFTPIDVFGFHLILTALATTVFFIFILDRIRFSGFTKAQTLQKSRDEILKLSQFAGKLNQNFELRRILDEIIPFMERTYGIQGTLLQLYNPQNNCLEYFFTNFQDFHDEKLQAYVKALKFPVTKGSAAGSILMRGKPIFFSSTRLAMRHAESDPLYHFVRNAGIQAAFLVPLLVQGKPTAMLYFSNYDRKLDLSPDDRNSINAFCQQIAGGIQASHLIEAVNAEKEKSDRLLLNILPAAIADELKEKGSVPPVMYENVTILFTDFKGFTRHAADMSPADLVRELDGIFGQFDQIAERYKLEKLKTIGDSYMCVGGLPSLNTTHAVDATLAALEMISFIRQTNAIRMAETGKAFWEIRVGLHTGSVVAGVIGKNKFAYDIWGDAVNIASRMESAGEPGKLNVSADTAGVIRDFFHTEPRGEIEVKNRGSMEMYFVRSVKPELLDHHGRPNKEFETRYRAL